MSQGAASVARLCPDCGADNPPGAATCWLCGKAITGSELPSAAEESRPPQFGLNSMLLVVTLICVLLGLMTVAPGLAILLAFVSVPALFRAVAARKRQAAESGPPTTGQRVVMFLSSLLLLTLISIAAFIAFFAACMVVCVVGDVNNENTVILGLILATLTGLVVLFQLAYLTWPRKK